MLDLLRAVYGEVLIPPAVAEEVSHGGPGAVHLAQVPWLRIQRPQDMSAVDRLLRVGHLHQGEAEAIVLASEIRARLLLDERRGSRVATQRGISTSGVVGVLLVAKSLRLIDRVEPLLEQMRLAGVHLSARLIRQALRLAGEES